MFARFKIKYHPEESVKRKEEQVSGLKVNFASYYAHVFIYFFDFLNNYSIIFVLETCGSFPGNAGIGRNR